MGRALPVVDHKVDILLNDTLSADLASVHRQLDAIHVQLGQPLWKVLGQETLKGAFVETRYMMGGVFTPNKFLKDMADAGFTMGQLATALDKAGIQGVGDAIRGHKPIMSEGGLVNQLSLPPRSETFRFSLVLAIRAALQQPRRDTSKLFWRELAETQHTKHGFGSFVATPFMQFGVLDVDALFSLWSSKPFYMPIWQLADEFHAAGIVDAVRAFKLLTGYDPGAGVAAINALPMAPPATPRILNVKIWAAREGRRQVEVEVRDTLAATLAEANARLRLPTPVLELWNKDALSLSYSSLTDRLLCYAATQADIDDMDALTST